MRPRSNQNQLPVSVARLADIDLRQLQVCGIEGVILDLDNTLVSEDDRYLSPGAEEWVRLAKRAEIDLFLLSNGKRRYRVIYWSKRLQIPALSPAHKPFPSSFRKALRSMNCLPHQAIVVGDSWHTDVLGARLVGCAAIQVASLPHPLRWWERLAGRWLQIPYQTIETLLPFDHEDD